MFKTHCSVPYSDRLIIAGIQKVTIPTIPIVMIINGETLGAGNSTPIMQASFNAKPSNIKQIVSKLDIVLFLSLSVDIAFIYALFA